MLWLPGVNFFFSFGANLLLSGFEKPLEGITAESFSHHCVTLPVKEKCLSWASPKPPSLRSALTAPSGDGERRQPLSPAAAQRAPRAGRSRRPSTLRSLPEHTQEWKGKEGSDEEEPAAKHLAGSGRRGWREEERSLRGTRWLRSLRLARQKQGNV